MDNIGESERKRLGWDPLGKEREFLDMIYPYDGYALFLNNKGEERKYGIDISVFDKNWNIIGWIDLETRKNILSKYSSIHVPKYSFRDFWEEKNEKISPKILHYEKYPRKSFHVSWSIPENKMFLIRGDNVLQSKEKEVFDSQRNKNIFVYDVSRSKCKEVSRENLIELIILEINRKETVQMKL